MRITNFTFLINGYFKPNRVGNLSSSIKVFLSYRSTITAKFIQQKITALHPEMHGCVRNALVVDNLNHRISSKSKSAILPLFANPFKLNLVAGGSGACAWSGINAGKG